MRWLTGAATEDGRELEWAVPDPTGVTRLPEDTDRPPPADGEEDPPPY